MKAFWLRILIQCQFFACLVPLGAWGDTITLQPVADTFLSSRNPDFNAGGQVFFDAGTDAGTFSISGIRRGLVRFDLGSIPPGSTITSAVLTLKVVKLPDSAVDSIFDLFRVNAAWGEGARSGNNGAPALAGESTWNARQFGSANWTTPGAAADASGTSSAAALVTALLGGDFNWSGPGMMVDLQSWLENPAQNFGWLLVSRAEGALRTVRAFGARESGTGGRLQIGFTPPTFNQAPTVIITTPADGATFAAPAVVTIEAAASDSDGSVTNVQFFDNGISLGSDAISPFTLVTNFYPGSHVLVAVATDDRGAATTSSSVSISVTNVVINDPIQARVSKGDITIELETVADGMASPLGMDVPDDGSGRMFVYDQDGSIWVLTSTGVRLNTRLLDLRSQLVQLEAYDERGLLGMALHPDFARNQLLYTYTSEATNGPADFQTGVTNNHQSVISEWRISMVDSNVVDLATRREVMRIDQPQSNHNGGAMHFGYDGLLYVALGDGGRANDTGAGHLAGGNAQDLNRIWGKVIRLDVDGRNAANGKYGIPATNPFVTNGLPEIFAYGLRNPFCFSFDRATGELYLADVGQNRVEEINIIVRGGNYGWNVREGTFWFDAATGNEVNAPVRPPPTGMVDPIAQYDHDDGLAVIGGYLYRGSAIPPLAGRYVFGDWGSFSAPSGRLYYLDATNGVKELRIGREDRSLGSWLKGFGEGPDGELYAFTTRALGPAGSSGRMVKLVPAPADLSLGPLTLNNGTNAAATWAGGLGPFALQHKASLRDLAWMQTAVTDQTAATSSGRGSAGFFRVRDAAHIPPIPFTAYLTGAAERPPTGAAGTGLGMFVLDGNTLTFNISYTGLSGAATAGHIHGPAPAATNASVLIDLVPYHGGAWGSAGALSGVILLTDTQKAHLLAGRTYVNLHTTAFPGGEIRGQIAPVNLQVSLGGANENGPLAVPGQGLGNLALVGNRLTLNLTYNALTGPANASHIRGPATLFQNAGVLVDLNSVTVDAYGVSGALSGTLTLTAEQLAYVIDGLTYINFHTTAHPGGEIRGQIVPHVGGVPFTALLSGLAERPTPVTNLATGDATLSLDGDMLTFNISYTGLSAAATAAHIHGATNTTGAAGVMIDLTPFNGGAFGTSGTLSGSVELNKPQRDALLSGLTYIQLHTPSHPAGELRGQIAPVAMTAGLSGVNERPAAVTTTGYGLGTFALVRDQLTLAVTYRGLSGPATASHIHGSAGFLGSAGVLVDLQGYNGGAFGVSGSLSGIVPLTVSQLLNVIDNNTYVNVHTTANASGEIRGQLMK